MIMGSSNITDSGTEGNQKKLHRIPAKIPASSPVHRAQTGNFLPCQKNDRSSRQWQPQIMGSHLYNQAIKELHEAEGDASYNHKNVEEEANTDGNQSTDTGRLGGLGLGVLPDQEQDQTDQGNAAAQQTPAKTAVIHNGRGDGSILSGATVGAEGGGVT